MTLEKWCHCQKLRGYDPFFQGSWRLQVHISRKSPSQLFCFNLGPWAPKSIWVEIKPLIKSQIFVHVSIYQGKPFGVPIVPEGLRLDMGPPDLQTGGHVGLLEVGEGTTFTRVRVLCFRVKTLQVCEKDSLVGINGRRQFGRLRSQRRLCNFIAMNIDAGDLPKSGLGKDDMLPLAVLHPGSL